MKRLAKKIDKIIATVPMWMVIITAIALYIIISAAVYGISALTKG